MSKREAVELVRRLDTSCRPIALQLTIDPNLLSRWVREAEDAPAALLPAPGRERTRRSRG